jgi:hypothetical protein
MMTKYRYLSHVEVGQKSVKAVLDDGSILVGVHRDVDFVTTEPPNSSQEGTLFARLTVRLATEQHTDTDGAQGIESEQW